MANLQGFLEGARGIISDITRRLRENEDLEGFNGCDIQFEALFLNIYRMTMRYDQCRPLINISNEYLQVVRDMKRYLFQMTFPV